MVTTKLAGISQISSSMPIAILLLTCVLNGIVMWRMVKRESVIIGTLYALGYKKSQIQSHYIRYPLAISMIGGIAGTLFGSLLLKPMLSFMLTYFNMPVGTVDFSLRYVIISLLLPVIFLCAAGYFVVGRALMNSPLVLLRGGKLNGKTGFIEKYLKLDRLKFTTKFKIREQLRSIARSAFLLLGIALATMLLLLGFTAKSSMDNLVKNEFEKAFQYNYSYVLRTVNQGSPASGEAFMELPFTLSGDEKTSITVYGIHPSSKFVTLQDKAGNLLGNDEILMTSSLADKLKVKAGDTITIRNKLDSKDYRITADQIAKSNVGNYIYMPIDSFNSLFGYPKDSYMGLWSNEKLDLPEDQLLTVVTKADLINAFQTMTQPIQSVVGILSFMSFLIGLIVIYVVTSMIIEENKENISLMKILGYRKKEVYSLILNSSAFMVVAGYILGIPLILSFLGAMLKSLTKEMSVSLPVTVNYVFLILGFVIVYLTYEISKALSRKKLNRISMNEILKSRME
jgi:putative ABC transport system permease protein